VNDYHHFDEPNRKSVTILRISFTMAGADVSTLTVSITRCTFRNNMQAEYNIPAIIKNLASVKVHSQTCNIVKRQHAVEELLHIHRVIKRIYY
jgi:hypothetical protein